MIEILVVDDFEPFRRDVTSMIQKHPHPRAVEEVWDGLQAIHKAAELQPDLVLLDIGLPTLNGIEAARIIRCNSPLANIVFLTQESSPEIVTEAFNLGARGYIVKLDVARDLLIGIEAVVRGEKFVSSSLEGNGAQDFTIRDQPNFPK